jgi:hypothetical protein
MTISRTHNPPAGSAGTSLDDVLRSLGHDCPLGCARASTELDASVWLTRTGLPLADVATPALVVVDSSASLAPANRTFQLVRFVDRCARSDGVRVRERRASDRGDAGRPAVPAGAGNDGQARAMGSGSPFPTA